jgi:hypothetical protein
VQAPRGTINLHILVIKISRDPLGGTGKEDRLSYPWNRFQDAKQKIRPKRVHVWSMSLHVKMRFQETPSEQS